MQIFSLKVKDFGCLSGEVSVTFGPGLNVVYGPNEIGKSTLLRAIEYALTVKADVTGGAREKIAPRAGGVPTVNLSFTQDGCRCELEKIYKGQGGRATLRVTEPNGKTALLSDDDADSRLRDMLGVQETKRQRKNEDHLGIWPLLWIRQGESGLAPSERLNDLAKQDLGARLSELSGEVLAGADSERVLAKVKEEYARFFTESGTEARKADAPLHLARQCLADSAESVSSLERLLEVHGQSMDRLADVQSELIALREQLPRLKRRRDEVNAFAERARHVQSAVQVLEADLRGLDADAKRLGRLVDERTNLREAISVLGQQVQETKIEHAAAENLAQQHADRLPQVIERLVAAQQAVKAVRRASDRLQAHIESLRARKELDRITAQREQTSKLKEALRDGNAELAALQIDSKSLKKLRAAAQKVRDEQIALDVVAATVTIVAGGAVTARLGDETIRLEAGASVRRSIVESTSMELGGHTITVAPGGTELADLRDRVATAQVKFSELLAAAAVTSVQEAEAQQERRVKLEASVEGLTERLAQLAPEGVEALEAEVARLARAAQQHEARRDEGAQPGDIPLPETLDLALEEAVARAAAADESQATVDNAQAEKAAFDRDAAQLLASAKQLCDRAADQKIRLADNLLKLQSAVAADGEDGALAAGQSAIAKSMATKQADIVKQQQLLDGRTVQDVEEEHARAEVAVTSAEEEMKRKEVEQEGLRSRLTAAEVLGLDERLDKARAERDRASGDVVRLERRAKAAALLYNTLVACRDAARARYLAPLEEEVKALLPLLMRGAVASFDETFAVTSLSRQASGEDSFETLSGGCQEQLGVLIRLAIASVLARDDEPLVVMLDDALVSSDEERYRRMALVFTRCARKLQIVMATCHWERYRELGVAAAQAHDLRQLRASSAPMADAAFRMLGSQETTPVSIVR